nr:hypothetical protein [Tanacetum cinerariifolium]
GQSFAKFPFEEEILEFLRFLGHSTQIKTLTDVNVNKLYQPWRSFATVINKCLTGKSSGIDSLRISQAQILWGLYNNNNVDYAYLIWEDFMYQVEHTNQKKSNEMYYPRLTEVIIDYFMTRKPSIPRRNRVNWHYIRDDVLFSMNKVVSRHQTTQQYGVILPIELTNDDIRNSKAYKEYYACANGEATPKPKASARKKKGGFASSTTPPTPIDTPTPTTTVVAALRLSAAAKGKQPVRATTPTEPTDFERTETEQLKIVLRRSRQETHISQQRGSGTDEGTGSRPGVPDVPSDNSEEDLSWNSSDDEDLDEQTKGRDKSKGDKTNESDDDDDDQDEAEKVTDDNDNEEEVPKIDEQEEEESFDPIPRTPKDNEDDDNNEEDQGLRIGEEERMQEEEDAEELYRDSDAQQESSSTSSIMINLLNPITDPDRVKSLEDNFSNIPGIVNQYMHQQMPEAVQEAVQTQTNWLQDSIQRENDEFLKTIDENMKKIIKEHVKTRVKAQVLVEAYDADKTILDIYEESTFLKRRREDDDQEGPSAGSDRGSKRRREGGSMHQLALHLNQLPGVQADLSQGLNLASKYAFAEEPVQTTCQMEEPSHSVFETGAKDQPIIQNTQHPEWFSQPRRPPTPDRDWNKFVPAAQGNAQSWISVLAKQTDARSLFNELLDTPINFSNFIMSRLGVDTLTPELLAGPTYELIRGS